MKLLRFQALRDLLDRYGAVWRAAWAVRHQFDTRPRAHDELAFLPAQLELEVGS